ncbi:MAG: hypothetical protein WDO56_21255 [Gammaproteobacteria bacterium]
MKLELTAFGSLGLALLYASAYFLPLVGTYTSYFVPSVWSDVVYPSAVAAIVLAPLLWLLSRAIAARRDGPLIQVVLWLLLTTLVFVAIGSVLEAADYSRTDFLLLFMGSKVTLAQMRLLKVIAVFGGFSVSAIVVWALRGRWQAAARLLASLGYAMVLLAVVRVWHYAPERKLTELKGVISRSGSAVAVPVPLPARRVVWVIFDELDYGIVFGGGWAEANGALPNFHRVGAEAVFAERAFSPARDTMDSLPALLMGLPVKGTRFDGQGRMFLNASDSSERAISEAGSVFERVPGGLAASAILGHYHPYCQIFRHAGQCYSPYVGNAGRWFDGLVPFGEAATSLSRWIPAIPRHIPESVLKAFEPMYRISYEMSERLTQYVAMNNRSLVFIHLNVPHFPAEYAQKSLHLTPAAEYQEAYRQNLLFSDKLLGQVLSTIENSARASAQDTLLIVSSDHWERRASQRQARPIPFIAWHVGERQGVRLTEPISTIHTAALVEDFLAGRVATQAEIANWWSNKPFYATWIPSTNIY